jgi:DNA-directed RNA polymerase specialized sigma24 family protein
MRLDVMSNVVIVDDAALVAGALAGNRHAFGQLVVRYQSSVCGLAYSACGNVSQSEDVAQEAFHYCLAKNRGIEGTGQVQVLALWHRAEFDP